MAAYTINSGGLEYFDQKTGADTTTTADQWTISARSTLVVDTDTYACQNRVLANGAIDVVSFSGIGGTLYLDGTQVRVIPFDTGTGTVPAAGTTVTQGGVSAQFLGVWASWITDPVVEGGAMPASGYIKVKYKTGGDFAAGTLTGIGANATGADVVGWIEVRGMSPYTLTMPRTASFRTRGDWFELGTTSGSRGQVLPCPTCQTGAAMIPGVWVETAPSSGVFERWFNASQTVAGTNIPTDARGSCFWSVTTGIRFGNDGTNNVGRLPVAGCRVRIPNVLCTTGNTRGTNTRVVPNSTLGSRFRFDTTTYGDIDIENTSLGWYCNFDRAYRVRFVNSATSDVLVLTYVAQPLDVENFIVAPAANTSITNQAVQIDGAAGGLVKNGAVVRDSHGSSVYSCIWIRYSSDVTLENIFAAQLQVRASSLGGPIQSVQSSRITLTNCWAASGKITFDSCRTLRINQHHYTDSWRGATITSQDMPVIDMLNGCDNVVIDGIDFAGFPGGASVGLGPADSLVKAVSCSNITLRNVGSAATPLDCSSPRATNYLFNSGGLNSKVRIQRVWLTNTRSSWQWFFNTSDSDFTIESSGTDYADNIGVNPRNGLPKGVRGNVDNSIAGTGYIGLHWRDYFTSATAGRIDLVAVAPTPATAAQAVFTAGAPTFAGGNGALLYNVGDQIIWEMPYFARGHTRAKNTSPLGSVALLKLTTEFQYDLGAGYNGTWLTINQTNWNNVGVIDPTIGIRLKVRATCVTANTGTMSENAITYMAFPTDTTAVAQGLGTYPLDTNTLALTGLKNPSEVRVFAAGTTTEIGGAETITSGTFSQQIDSGAYPSVDISVLALGYQNIRYLAVPFSGSDISIPVLQVIDRQYANA